MAKKQPVKRQPNGTSQPGSSVKKATPPKRKRAAPPAKKAKAKTAKQPQAGRDAIGRFAAGNPGGPGRAPAFREAAYLRAARTTITPERLVKVFEANYRAAIKGSIPAMRLLYEQLLPARTERVLIEQEFTLPWESDNEEFRVAGMKPGEIDNMLLATLSDMIQRRMEHEQHIRQRHNSVNATNVIEHDPELQ